MLDAVRRVLARVALQQYRKLGAFLVRNIDRLDSFRLHCFLEEGKTARFHASLEQMRRQDPNQ
jgi:hypothetical protein